MGTTKDLYAFLDYKAYQLRMLSLIMTTKGGSGHPTSCLSAADLVATLFFHSMHHNPRNFDHPDSDRFILSKGHASPLLYAAWKELGILSMEDILQYRSIHSVLEGHPTWRFRYAEAATGSLGMGLSVGVGMALAAQRDNRNAHMFVLLGDSEIAEGSIWEAAEIAHYYGLHNLVAFLDCNRLGQSTETLHGHHMQRYADKFHAFGWAVETIDGHDVHQIVAASDRARAQEKQPSIILAKTFKGYGIDYVENKEGFHGKVFAADELQKALDALSVRFEKAAHYDGDYVWHSVEFEPEQEKKNDCVGVSLDTISCKKGSMIATRKAYGRALALLGGKCSTIVALDAEVKNSTYAQEFEKKYPDRFFQCFVAEQNMISMGVGFDNRGKIPFISTFGAFFSRAFDQVRMAAIGGARLCLVGSHAGVSIGQDGPSQMGLEDIALMRCLPGSVVLYPSDAVSTFKLVEQMVEYTQGISYLRTTRMDTPVIYDADEDFLIGGCKVLRQSENDVVCVIAAGVTLFQSLDAYEILKEKGIYITVIDLYSIKPLDSKTIRACAKKVSFVLTVEDHYQEGGIGSAICYELAHMNVVIKVLAVKKLPRSGKPGELLAWAGIDAQAIVEQVLAEV
jgi:transketolase